MKLEQGDYAVNRIEISTIKDAKSEAAIKTYRIGKSKAIVLIVGLIAVCAALLMYYVSVGYFEISLSEAYHLLWDHITGNIDPDKELEDYVAWTRLGCGIAGVLGGIGLAMAGASMQSLMRNPMADPYTTGISAGAGLGATIAVVSGITMFSGRLGTITNAFFFALIPVVVILMISKVRSASPSIMVLAGLAMMYMFTAIITMLLLWADPMDLNIIYRWQVGSLEYAKWTDIPIMLGIVVVGSILLQKMAAKMNIVASGDDNAKTLGIDAERFRIIGLLIISVMSAGVVSFIGLVGFIGLIAPHIMRMIVGTDNRYLLPASAAFGAVLMIGSDLIGKTLFSPAIIQVGVVTAFLGGPMLLYLIIRKKREVW